MTEPSTPTRSGQSHAPVLPGYLDARPRGTDLRVWCRWCCHWHIHGAAPIGTAVHLLAHCFAPDSPYRRGGYRIEVTSTPYSEVRGSVRRATSAQQRALSVGRVSPVVQALRAQPDPAPGRRP